MNHIHVHTVVHCSEAAVVVVAAAAATHELLSRVPVELLFRALSAELKRGSLSLLHRGFP